MIELKNLSKKYGSKKILDTLNISFDEGQVYGIVGKNGAGKTTLFRCIAGLEKYAGKVESPFNPLKNHLGFLPTEPYLFPRMTGLEYLRLLTNARGIQLKNIDRKNIFDLPLYQYAINYSTGMKKKLAITAVLLQENQVYLLDEPYNGVDIQSNIILTEIIKRLKELYKTILISSHVFSLLKEVCDIVFVLENGKITRSVRKNEFDELENEMKEIFIGDKINKMELV